MEKTYVIGGVVCRERSVSAEIIAPSGEIKKVRLTPKMWDSHGVGSGDVISREAFRAILDDSEKCGAVTKALSLLTGAPHSYRALSEKLKKSGFGEDAVNSALLLVRKRGLIDEESDAAAGALRLASKSRRGPSRVKSDLMHKGYPASVAAKAASSVPDGIYRKALDELIARKCRAGVPEERSERDKLIASLTRAGFSPRVALEALESNDVT